MGALGKGGSGIGRCASGRCGDVGSGVEAAAEDETQLIEEKAKVGVVLAVGPVGPESMAVLGIAVSTLNSRSAGVGSVLVAGSVARTSKVWGP